MNHGTVYTKNTFIDYVQSPIGLLECKASEKGLEHVIFCGSKTNAIKPNHITDLCKQQLNQYFDNERNQFSLPLDVKGTKFQQQVWQCLSSIPFGKTASYKQIAKQINNPKGSQAVGGANGRNPISIIVPCHRVIGSTGALTGYAGGIERKLWLLKHEGIELPACNDIEEHTFGNAFKSRQSKTKFLT